MKKLYFMLVAMLMAFSANAADMYLNVPGDFNSWNPKGVKLVDGKATATVTGVTAEKNCWKIKIWNGTADEWYSNGETVGVGEYTLSGNVDPGMYFSEDLYGKTISISWDQSTKKMTIAVEGSTPGPGTDPGTEEPEVKDMYLNVPGDFNSWNPNGVKLVDGKATATVSGVTAEKNLWKIKIWNGSSDEWYSNAQTLGVGEYTLSDNTDPGMKFADELLGKTISISWDQSTKKMTIAVEGSTTDPGENPGTEEPEVKDMYLNVPGDWNEWIPDGVKLVDGKATATVSGVNAENNNWKIKIWNGTADEWYSTGGVIAAGVYTMTGDNETNMSFANELLGKTISISWDNATKTMTVATAGTTPGTGEDPVVELPEHLYIIGNVNGYDWATDKGVELTRAEGSNVFTASNVTIDNADSGDGYFTFVTKLGANWDAVNGSHRYGAPAKDEPVNIDAEHEVVKYVTDVNASSAKSWKIGAGTYDFSVDFGTNKLTVKSSTASAIGAVNAEANGAAVYFNLQGARVANPTTGLYIKVQNGKSVKVAL